MSAPAIDGGKLRAVAIIPARLGSQRLPRKMLLRETGRCLFEHTHECVARSGVFEEVVVATDSAEIEAAARTAGVRVVRTRDDHESGTDRVFEAWQTLFATSADGRGIDVVVNVQGDEPDVAAGDLAALVRAFSDARVEMATLAVPIEDAEDVARANIVKVVCDANGDALYFSRAAIPSRGHARAEVASMPQSAVFRRHVGVYAFTPAALERFCMLRTGILEAHENLEQLRWLEAGRRVRVVPASRVPEGIDTAQDYARFVARVRQTPDGGRDGEHTSSVGIDRAKARGA